MGASGEQLALHQRKIPPAFQRSVQRHRTLAAGHGSAVEGDQLFRLILEEKPLDPALCRVGAAHGDAEIGLTDLVAADFIVENSQCLGVFSRDHNAAGVAVNPVAQRGSKGVFPLGVPLLLLVEIRLNVVDEGVDLLRFIRMTQVGIRPPHFIVFCNDARLFHFSYQRYLENCIRNTFGLEGTPIILSIRQKGDKEE